MGTIIPSTPRAASWQRANTDWMHNAKWGVLCHYLADIASCTTATEMSAEQWNAQIDAFDVPGLAAQLAAVKAGNPDSLVAFNPGVLLQVMTEYEDYTAGETAGLFPVDGCERYMKGSQVPILTFLGPSWGQTPPRFADEFVIAYTREVAARGGVATWDAAIEKSGLIEEHCFKQLQALSRAMMT